MSNVEIVKSVQSHGVPCDICGCKRGLIMKHTDNKRKVTVKCDICPTCKYCTKIIPVDDKIGNDLYCQKSCPMCHICGGSHVFDGTGTLLNPVCRMDDGKLCHRSCLKCQVCDQTGTDVNPLDIDHDGHNGIFHKSCRTCQICHVTGPHPENHGIVHLVDIEESKVIRYGHLICLMKTKCTECDGFLPCHSVIDIEKDTILPDYF